MDKIELIKEAIEKADNFVSGLSVEAINVPFLGSLKNRALLNNLGKLSTRYGEVGCHRGGSYCSTVYGNDNLVTATVIDSFESDITKNEGAEADFLRNSAAFTPVGTKLKLIKSDCFNIDFKDVQQPIDLYLFDGPHGEEDQAKAITYYLPVLADTFIFCCDDYGWDDVRKGTQRGIKEAGLEVLFERELVTEEEYLNTSWWTGFYVALLKKPATKTPTPKTPKTKKSTTKKK